MTKIKIFAESWRIYLPHISKDLVYLERWIHDRTSKLKHQKLFWQNQQKLFFYVQRTLPWSILIRIGLSNLQHVAEHLLFQCSQMDIWFWEYWYLQSFQSKSLPLEVSKFLISVKTGFGILVNLYYDFL